MCGTAAYLSPEQLDGKFTNGYTNIVGTFCLLSVLKCQSFAHECLTNEAERNLSIPQNDEVLHGFGSLFMNCIDLPCWSRVNSLCIFLTFLQIGGPSAC